MTTWSYALENRLPYFFIFIFEGLFLSFKSKNTIFRIIGISKFQEKELLDLKFINLFEDKIFYTIEVSKFWKKELQ